MNDLGEALPRPTSTPPVSTYVAVARGRAASREAGDVPATVHEHPALSSADPSGSGRSALELAFGRADKDRLDTTAVHLRLALPHVRAALRQLRDSCRAHVDARSADADADADASDVATEVSALASQLMEMDAEALRACCKPVVEHARRLLGVTGRRSTERTQLVTLLFSLSRFLPLVASLDPDPDPDPVENRPRDTATDASSPDDRGPTVSLSLAAHDAAVRERARATALLDDAVAAAADPPAPGPTPPAAADRVARVVAGLRAYAAAVSAWQAALVEDELRAESIAGVDVAGRRVPAPRFSSAARREPAAAGASTSALRRAASMTVADADSGMGMGFARGTPRFEYPRPPTSSRPSAQGLGTPSRRSSVKSHVSLSLDSELEEARDEDGDVFVVEPEPGTGTPGTGTGTPGTGPSPVEPLRLRRTTSEASGSLAEAAFERRARALDPADVGPAGSGPASGSIATPRPMSYAGALAAKVSAEEPAPRVGTHAPGSARVSGPTSIPAPSPTTIPAPRESPRDRAPPSPSGSFAPRPYRDALLPPRERYGGGDSMLAHTLMKNAAARAAGGVVAAAAPRSPGMDGETEGKSNVAPAGAGPSPVGVEVVARAASQLVASSSGGFPRSSSSSSSALGALGALGDGAAAHPGSRRVADSPSRSTRTSSLASSPRHSLGSLVPGGGVLVCRICERTVAEEGMGPHSACCATLRDADARAAAAGGSVGDRLRAAAATAAALASDRGVSVARAARYAAGEPLMDDVEARAIARTCAIVSESPSLAPGASAERPVDAGSVPGSIPGGGGVAPALRDARDRLDDMAAASWARGHHAAETVAAHLSAIVRRWIDVDAGVHAGSPSRRMSRRSNHASRPRYPAPGGGYSDARLASFGLDQSGIVDGEWSGGGSSPKSSDHPGSPLSPRSPRATWTGPWGANSVPGSPAHPGHYARPVGAGAGPGAGDGGLAAEDFEIVKPISRGAHGKVHLCRKRATGDVYAIKVMRKKDLIYKNMVSQAMAERDALINTDNPFIVKLYYSFSSTRHIYIVTEYAVGGDLYSLLQQFGRLEENHCRQYAAEITLALEYCHERGIIHRDVKPDNLLIAANGHLKLTDFGLSKIGVARTGVGTSANTAVARDVPTSARTRTARVSDGSVDPRAANATDPHDGGGGSWGTGGAAAAAAGSAGAGHTDARAGHTLNPNPNLPNPAPSSAYAPSTYAASSAYAPSAYATSGYGSDAGAAGGSSDLGSSKFDYSRSGAREDAGAGMAKGTPDYLAPEVLMCEPYGPEVDWWALGAVVFELLVGVPPFHAETPVKIFENILGGDIAWPPDPDPNRPPAGSDSDSDDNDAGLSPVAKDFIAQLLRPEADLRLGAARGAAEVKAHAFFRGVDFDAVLASQQRDVAGGDDDDQGGCVPVFVPQPDDPLDTSYFARKPRRGAERARRRSSGSSDRSGSAFAAGGFSSASASASASGTGLAHGAPPGSELGADSLVAAVAVETMTYLGGSRRGRRPRRSSLGNSSLGNPGTYADSNPASSRATSEAGDSDDEFGFGFGRSYRRGGGGLRRGIIVAGPQPQPQDRANARDGDRGSPSRRGRSREASPGPAHHVGSPTAGVGVGGSLSLGLGPGGVRPSPLKHPSGIHSRLGHAGATAGTAAGARGDEAEWRVSMSPEDGYDPRGRAAASVGRAPFRSAEEEDAELIRAQIPASECGDDGDDDSPATGTAAAGGSGAALPVPASVAIDAGDSSTTSDSESGSDDSEAHAAQVEAEAAVLSDFAYTNLTELAQRNLANLNEAARSRGGTPRTSAGAAHFEGVGSFSPAYATNANPRGSLRRRSSAESLRQLSRESSARSLTWSDRDEEGVFPIRGG